MDEKTTAIIAKANVQFEGLAVQVKLSGKDTVGAFSVVEFQLQPKTLGAPLHVRGEEDVFLTVIDGELVLQMDELVSTVREHLWIKIPSGTAFAAWNQAEVATRYMEIIRPAGFEQKYLELDAILKSGDPIEYETLQVLDAKYCSKTDFQSIFVLSEQYGLQYDQRFQSICW
jgi:uncharacterized cupin superfamily protein